MTANLFVLALLYGQPCVAAADLFDTEGEAVNDAERQIGRGGVSADEQVYLAWKRAWHVNRIADAGDRKSDDLKRQNEVARALATVDEGLRAIPYAERAVALAEKTRKMRNISTALTTAALAYQSAGRFDEAYKRAARAIEVEPGNREAMEVHYLLKGRGDPADTGVAPGLPPKKSKKGANR